MHARSTSLLLVALALAAPALASPAEAQLGRKIRDTAKRAAEREVLRQVDRKVTETVRCAVEDQACIRRAEREGKQVELTGRRAAGAGATKGVGTRANYDFVPGERVLFAEDFSRDVPGDFPRSLELLQGTLEVVETDGGRFLKATSPARFVVPLHETLPERFTVEFDVHLVDSWHQVFLVTSEPKEGYKKLFVNQALPHYPHSYVQVSGHSKSGVRGGSGGESLAEDKRLGSEPVPVRVMADGSHVKVYIGEHRVANVPNADLRRSRRLAILTGGYLTPERPVLLGPIRIAAGGRSLYDALSEKGRVVTHGILFDTGSDRIRPESAPTLTEIGEMLRAHPDLRLVIEGHTDDVGRAADNQSLSEKRAAAVRQHLVRTYGVEPGRLQAKGFGASRPADSNDSAEGRQKNRRVELVKV